MQQSSKRFFSTSGDCHRVTLQDLRRPSEKRSKNFKPKTKKFVNEQDMMRKMEEQQELDQEFLL